MIIEDCPSPESQSELLAKSSFGVNDKPATGRQPNEWEVPGQIANPSYCKKFAIEAPYNLAHSKNAFSGWSCGFMIRKEGYSIGGAGSVVIVASRS
jgi:hypothetical protein